MIPSTPSSIPSQPIFKSQIPFLPKQVLLIILGIVLFVLGGLGGWQLALKQNSVAVSKKPPVNNSIASSSATFAQTVTKECQQQIAYKQYIIDPSEQWSGLITSTSLNYQLGGEIVKIEQKEKNDTPATFYTIASHQDPKIKVTVFGFDTADYFKTFEGSNLATPSDLKPISKSSLKVGDSVYVEAFTLTLNNPRALAETLSIKNLELEARLIFRYVK